MEISQTTAMSPSCSPTPTSSFGYRLGVWLLIACHGALVATGEVAAGQEQPEARSSSAESAIEWQPHTIETYSGEEIEAQIGTLEVPENRQNPHSETVRLSFLKLSSTAAKPAAPIVYLSGGPGASGINAARWAGDVFTALTAVADVVLLDQRGTGLSDRGLFCPGPGGPPDLNLFASSNPDAQWQQILEEVRGCAMQLRQRKIDIKGYTTSESADDLEALRLALGAKRLSLIGFSYGTHLGLDTIRRHGSKLERVALIGTEGPDHTRKLPSSLDTQMRQLSLLAAREPAVAAQVPDMYAVLQRLLDRLEKEPIAVPIELPDGSQVEVPVNAQGLRTILLYDLGDGNDFPFFPALLHTIDQGDTSLLAWFVRKRFRPGGGVPALYYAVDGASGISPERQARILREAESSVFGNLEEGFFELVEALGSTILDESYRAPIVSDVDTLFISGSLDSNTPPYQAEQMRWGMPRAQHLVIENAGHEDMFGWQPVTQLLLDYFAGRGISKTRLARPAPRFLTVAEAKAQRLGE